MGIGEDEAILVGDKTAAAVSIADRTVYVVLGLLQRQPAHDLVVAQFDIGGQQTAIDPDKLLIERTIGFAVVKLPAVDHENGRVAKPFDVLGRDAHFLGQARVGVGPDRVGLGGGGGE